MTSNEAMINLTYAMKSKIENWDYFENLSYATTLIFTDTDMLNVNKPNLGYLRLSYHNYVNYDIKTHKLTH